MKKLDTNVNTQLWVNNIIKGTESILAAGRIVSLEARNDLKKCLLLLQEVNGKSFHWDVSLYTIAEQTMKTSATIIPLSIQSQDPGVDLQEEDDEHKHDHNEPVDEDSTCRPNILYLGEYLICIETPPFWTIGRFLMFACDTYFAMKKKKKQEKQF